MSASGVSPRARSPRGLRRWYISVCPLAALTLVLALVAPYTKVEESFPLQATHDVMFKIGASLETLSALRPSRPWKEEGGDAPSMRSGTGQRGGHVRENTPRRLSVSVPGVVTFSIGQTARFDHNEFPGVVPRSFVPSILIALVARPIVSVLDISAALVGGTRHGLSFHDWGGLYVQILIRCIVGIASVSALVLFARSFARKLGPASATIFLLLLSMQFHLPFYASRTLPNTFAAAVVWVALAFWMSHSEGMTIALMAFAGLIIRCDTVLIAIPVGVSMLLAGRLHIAKTVIVATLSTLLCLAISIPLDSWFWGRWVWPELEVLFFNTIQNRSNEWGTSPWHWYLTSALPRSLMLAYPLAPLGAYMERRVRSLFFVAAFYVFAYSFLPHKELRFMLPVLPLFTACAAPAALRIWHNRRKSLFAMSLSLGMYAGLLVCSVALVFFAAASVRNYPGGLAMSSLHALYEPQAAGARDSSPPPSVHVGVLPAMTGVSQFLERPDFLYSKQEDVPPTQLHAKGFDFLLSELPSVQGFACAGAIYAYSGLRIKPGAADIVSMVFRMRPSVYVHQRNGGSRPRLADAVRRDASFLRQHYFMEECK